MSKKSRCFRRLSLTKLLTCANAGRWEAFTSGANLNFTGNEAGHRIGWLDSGQRGWTLVTVAEHWSARLDTGQLG